MLTDGSADSREGVTKTAITSCPQRSQRRPLCPRAPATTAPTSLLLAHTLFSAEPCMLNFRILAEWQLDPWAGLHGLVLARMGPRLTEGTNQMPAPRLSGGHAPCKPRRRRGRDTAWLPRPAIASPAQPDGIMAWWQRRTQFLSRLGLKFSGKKSAAKNTVYMTC